MSNKRPILQDNQYAYPAMIMKKVIYMSNECGVCNAANPPRRYLIMGKVAFMSNIGRTLQDDQGAHPAMIMKKVKYISNECGVCNAADPPCR